MHRLRAMSAVSLAFAVSLALTVVVAGNQAASAGVVKVPRPDHVVVLIMENHSAVNILGNPAAPYLNALAAAGASMTQSFAITHPSQPNYVAMFSGSTGGIVDDSCPNTLTGDNLGSELIAAGLGFTTYSEDLPSVGYTGCTAGNYARKHNPAVNFTNIPPSSNQPLTAFPTDYTTLPAVSYVVPNLQNDMHDGTIAQGDSWVQANLKPYVSWATTHNSLLVVTWDEDDYGSNNQIPTLIVGAGVVPGTYPEHINHYDMLRTLQDAYGLAPIGASATAKPILDIWAPPSGAPSPSFTAVCTALSCSADGTASTPGIGSISGDSWDWGDGTAPTTGSTSNHTYATSGDYQVTLTVTNSASLAATVSQGVSPRAPATPSLFAADTFARTVSSGWGQADTGGTWALGGPASQFAVGSGSGTIRFTTPGTTLGATLTTATSTDTDLRMTVGTDRLANNNGLYIGIVGRHSSTNNEYQGRVRIAGTGTVYASFVALKGSASAVLVKGEIPIAGLTATAGGSLAVRLQATGTNPTTLRMKVWTAGTAEPAAWQQTATDTWAALQSAGSVGVNGYLSSGSTNVPVSLTVGGLTAGLTVAVPVNVPPTAGVALSCTNLICSADGSTSADSDGNIASYSWNWGDGSATTSGVTSNHTYASAGSFPVTLTVTDNQGATGTFSRTATPSVPANQPPVAVVTVNCLNLLCTADGTGSTDPDGTIASYSWNWGDGTAANSGSTATHSYAAAGTYLITLTVTDDRGGTNSGSASVAPTLAPNVKPNASIGVTCSQLACRGDSAGSSDPDGTITDYSWNWGDGTGASSGSTSTHTYATPGSFTVTLTVTDNRGGQGTASQTVTPTAPVDPSFAVDRFDRTVASGWGSANVGGAWTVVGGNTYFAVGAGAGSALMAKASAQVNAYLAGVSSASTDYTAGLAADKLASGNGTYLTIVGRRVGTNLEYESRIRVIATGAVYLSLSALTGTSTVIGLKNEIQVPGLTATPGAVLSSRLQVFGTNPTTIRAKVWSASSTEPTAWLLSTTDGTAALQAPGGVGWTAYLSGSSTVAPITLTITSLAARPVTP